MFYRKKIEKKISWLADALVGALENETFSTWAGSGYYGSQTSQEFKAAHTNTYNKYIFAAFLLLVLYWEENLCFSPNRKILLYSLVLLDVTLENRFYRYFCVVAMIMMLTYASKCVTFVCNHTYIALIWNWYRLVTEGDNCLFSEKLGRRFV